jgi:hypothetical protein
MKVEINGIATTKLNATYPQIKGLEDEELQERINQTLFKKIYDFKNIYEISPEYEYRERAEVTYNRNNLISVKYEGLLWHTFPAAHPVDIIDSITVDLKTGQAYELEDLFKSGVDYKDRLNGILRKEIARENITMLIEFEGIEEDQDFYLEEDRLIIYYQEYVYTTHAYGPLILKVPFTDIRGIIKLS